MSEMLRRFLTLMAKDLILVLRNHYLAVIIGLALLYALAVRFMIPADLSPKPDIVLWDATRGKLLQRHYQQQAQDKLITVNSGEAFQAALESRNRIGLRIRGEQVPERIDVVFQGYENARTRRLLGAGLQAEVAALLGKWGGYPAVETESLRPGVPTPEPPFNLSLVPIFVFSEAALVGMLLVAALLYSEKEERSLRAYRVSPGGVLEYLLARSAAMGLLGLAFTILLTILTIGLDANWLSILAVVFFAAVVMSLLALVVANMFENISQFLFAALALMVLFTLPTVSYFVPSLSPAALRLLPTYPLVFALREAYFPTGNTGMLISALGQLGVTLGVVLPLAAWTFKRQLVVRDV